MATEPQTSHETSTRARVPAGSSVPPAPASGEDVLAVSSGGAPDLASHRPPAGARGCRIDSVRIGGGSVLERYYEQHLQAARRHAQEQRARVALLTLVDEAMAMCRAARTDADASGTLEQAMDDELRVVEAVERAKAALDAEALTALARMRATAEALVAAQPATASRVPSDPVELVALEVSTATGLAQAEVGVRVELATGAASRFGRLRGLLAAGAVSLRRACQLVEETRHLVDDEAVAGVVESVFAPTRDGSGLSCGLFRQRLRRAILRADADSEAAAARRRAARKRNGAQAQIFDDGTGQLTVRNDADKIAAAMDRADAAARAAKAAGDPRSLDQLRADFLTGAAIFGQPASSGAHGTSPATSGAHGTSPAGADATWTAGADAGSTGRSGAASGECCPLTPEWFACFGQRPAGRVWIVVPVTTALGLDDAPCQMPGHGWVSAEQARALITAEGSTWQTMLADLDTGQALELSRKGYRPSRPMVEHVIAVDGVCRGPGCSVPASQCDLDHDLPYPDGPTDISNLSSKHRQHHRVRTAGFWTAVRDPNDATIAWRTSAGRRYVTYPADWLEDVRPRRRFGGFDHNPEPFTRPLGPVAQAEAAADPGPPPF